MNEQSLFIEALEKHDPAEREAFLDQIRAGDLVLRQRLERLLQHQQQRPGTVIGAYKLLQQPPFWPVPRPKSDGRSSVFSRSRREGDRKRFPYRIRHYNDGENARVFEEHAVMSASGSEPLTPIALSKDGPDRLVIEWSDGHRGIYTWRHLRDHCPCAGCREEREKPPDPFRVLKPSELVPLAPVRMPPVGRYAYKIVWNDGHDSGIYTLEHLRSLCQCPQCSVGAASVSER